MVQFVVTRLRADRRGATAIEYALIAALVAGAAMAGLIALGLSMELLFTDVAQHISNTTPARCVEVGSKCKK